MKDTYLIVDGNSLMYRAFHALPLMDADGIYTNAIYGFLSMLLKVIKEENVQYISVCFDEHGPTFRHTAYPDYKAGRAETPQELKQQFVTIRSLLEEMNISQYSLQGWEADDLLGTLSLKGAEKGLHPLLLTGDRDALQLVDNHVELMFTKKGISETIRFTPSTVFDEYGFSPEQVIDWKGLAGDSSDNIPGIPGIGDKTAVKLLQEYGTLENILAHASEIKGKISEKLIIWADQAKMCKDLATIRRNAPVEFNPAECILPDLQKSIPALKKLKLFSIIKRIGSTEEENVPSDHTFEVKIDFTDTVRLNQEQDLKDWILNLKTEDRPICILFEEKQVSLATVTGKNAVAFLEGDLLNPGMDPMEVLKILASEMSEYPAVVHDGKKILHQLDKAGLELPEKFEWDTMLGAYILNPQEKSYRLDALCGENPADARSLAKLYLTQRHQTETDGMTSLMKDIELPLSFVLFRMEKRGFTIDRKFLTGLGKKYTEEIDKLKNEVYQACGTSSFNLNSTQQLGEVLFEKMNLPHGKKTSKGYSTSAEVLEDLRPYAPDIIEPLLRYRQLSKLNSTYVESLLPLLDAENRVHSYFDQTGTATGRISSSEPNLQNIPVRTVEGKEIRRAFLPKPGWVLVDADYSQIELRLMAHFSKDEAMLDAFRLHQDVHARTASEIFEVPLSEVTPELRSRAKAVNFGLIYGISGFGLSRNTGVSRQEANHFIEQYFKKYPGVKRYMDEACQLGEKNGYARTMMGRRRYLPELKDTKAMVREFGKRAAMNTPVQGTAADLIKLAMVRIDEALRKNHMESRLILQVHDELLLECPPDEVEKASVLLREAMENVLELDVPLLVEVETGSDWAEAK